MGHLFAIAAGGQAILETLGCINAAVEGVFAIWSRGFLISSGVRVRTEYGEKPVYWVYRSARDYIEEIRYTAKPTLDKD